MSLQYDHLLTTENQHVSVFIGGVLSGTAPVRYWMKPRNCKSVDFFAVGGGGGGGCGGNNTGGAGGGCGGIAASFSVPAIFLPEMIAVKPGVGGLGGVSSNALGSTSGSGGAGGSSEIGNLLYAYGGGQGNSGNSGGASTNNTQTIVNPVVLTGFGISSYKTGNSTGSAGAYNTAATNIPFSSSDNLLVTPGGGGGGVGFAGANPNGAYAGASILTNISVTGSIYTLGGNHLAAVSGGSGTGNVSGITSIGGDGGNGLNYGIGDYSNMATLCLTRYPMFTGGGGGGAGLHLGGRGGNGGLGSGGGGGGAGYVSGGGIGGDGGAGFIIITAHF